MCSAWGGGVRRDVKEICFVSKRDGLRPLLIVDTKSQTFRFPSQPRTATDGIAPIGISIQIDDPHEESEREREERKRGERDEVKGDDETFTFRSAEFRIRVIIFPEG